MTPDAPVFAEIKALIVAETGHHYYEDKDAQLAERIGRRMAALHVADPRLYLERLQDDAAGPREWRLLESELTIKETFFFRFAEQFAALRARILPGLIAVHAEDRHLRIWSAGCSTGAEPYSLAVEIADLLGDALADWRVSILGTDLDEAALTQAREGRYGGWALRTVGTAERERLFDHEGKSWRLKPRYRGMVRFERQNILDLLDPLSPIGRDDYDLILCRNLLIYFRPDQATRLVAALGARLGAKGWLLLGHAEAGVAIDSGLDAAELHGVVGYRRPGDRSIEAPAPAIAFRAPSRPLPRRPIRPVRQLRRAIEAPAAPPPSAVGGVEAIRDLLSRGQTRAAREAIERARMTARGDALLLYLEGLGATADDDRAVAERAFRGAIYLDPDFAMAHYLLGRHLLAEGREPEGRRALANAADAVARASGDDAVREGEGLTVADLREAIRHRLGGAAR